MLFSYVFLTVEENFRRSALRQKGNFSTEVKYNNENTENGLCVETFSIGIV